MNRLILITKGENKGAFGFVSEKDYLAEKENLKVNLFTNGQVIRVPFVDTKPTSLNSDMTKNLVMIRRGFYKGYIGYTTVTETTLQRQLIQVFICSNGKLITVQASDVVPAAKKFQNKVTLVTTQVPQDFYQTSDTVYVNTLEPSSPTAGYFDFLQDYNPLQYFANEPSRVTHKNDDFKPQFENISDSLQQEKKDNQGDYNIAEYIDDDDNDGGGPKAIAGYNERYVYVNERYNPDYIKNNYNKEDQQRVLVIKSTLESIFTQFEIMFIDDSLDAIFSHVDQVLEIINGTDQKRGLKTMVNLTERDLEKFSIVYAYYYMNNTGITSRFDVRVTRLIKDSGLQLTNTNYFFGVIRNLEPFQKMDILQVKGDLDNYSKIFAKVTGKTIIPDSQTVFADTNLRIMNARKRKNSDPDHAQTNKNKYKYNSIHNYSKFHKIQDDQTARIKSTPIDYPALERFGKLTERELRQKYEDSIKNELTKISKTASTSERFKRLVLFIKAHQRENLFLKLATDYTLFDGKSAVEVFPTIGRIVKEYSQKKHERTLELIAVESSKIEYTHDQTSYNKHISKIIETGLVKELENVITAQNLQVKAPDDYKKLRWAVKNISRIVNGNLLKVEKDRYSGIITKLKSKFAKNMNDASKTGSQHIYKNFSRDHQKIELEGLRQRLNDISDKITIAPQARIARPVNKQIHDFALHVSDLEDKQSKTFTQEQVKALYASYRRSPQKLLN